MNNTDSTAHHVQDRLKALKAAYHDERKQLIQASLPQVRADAVAFMDHPAHYLPWEHGVMFVGGHLEDLQDRYDVPPARHRPSPEHVAALTDLFCEACELVTEELQATREQAAGVFDEIHARNVGVDPNEVEHDIAEALAELRDEERGRKEANHDDLA